MRRRTILRSRREGGFSLLELLIYVGIFATMIGAVVGLAVAASGQKVNSQATADINYQGEATMALITQTVRQATAINAPTAATSGSSLTLAMANGSVNPTTFASANDGKINRIQMSEGNPSVQNYLTNSHAQVTNLTFTNMSLPSTKGSILISFTLSYASSSNRQEFTFSKNFFGAATIP